MSLTSSQSDKLFELAKRFVKNIAWQEPYLGEREPQYTARVLAPGLQSEVTLLRHPGLVVRSDGILTPQPVKFDRATHFPDMSINFHHDRVVAVEVKFFDDTLSGQGYLTAIGQGVIYSSLGYTWSLVILVGKNSASRIDQAAVDSLNVTLQNTNVHVLVMENDFS
jgi:hypothetical protein